MEVVTWSNGSKNGMIDFLGHYARTYKLIDNLVCDKGNDDLSVQDAVSICKLRLLGEYHCILIKRSEELLEDSEVYLITYDGEASDGGDIHRLDMITIEKIAKQTLFTENC